MARKKVWVTWMAADGAGVREIVAALGKQGLETGGAPWIDDLEKMAWVELGNALLDAKTADIWLIACDRVAMEHKNNRYALSLIAAALRHQRGAQCPIMLLGLDFVPESNALPTPLRNLTLLSKSDKAWPAKVVAAAHAKKPATPPEFRLDVRANPMFGQWFEIGPVEGQWDGAMFGVSSDGTITHHATGPKGELPERAVLEYPIKDIKAEVGGASVTVWAVQNRLDAAHSYYVKVDGTPTQIVFGGHPGSDQAEVFVLTLA